MSIKTSVRYALSYILGSRLDKAYSRVKDSEVVSFDVFDTLIFRRCRPHDVFTAAEKKYNALSSSNIASFREDRLRAEHSARSKTTLEEITLDEIYDELAAKYDPSQLGKLKSAELEAELEAVYPNREMQRFYASMLDEGRKVIIVSDMYLPERIISRMLEQCGYRDYTNLYVSSEYRTSKRYGGLFRQVLNDEGNAGIFHIGDHVISDYLMPKKMGIKSFLYRSPRV